MKTSNIFRFAAILSVFVPLLLFARPERVALKATLSAESTIVHMGARVEFYLEMAFDSSFADSHTRILNRYCRAWDCEVLFANEKTGKIFRRVPYDVGMLIVQEPDDLVYLHNDSLIVEKMIVFLLSDEGEQIPPGTYQVKALYENNGGDKLEVYIDPDSKQYRQRPYPGPWSFWTGRIEAAPFLLRVLPAQAISVEMQVPSTISIDTSQNRAGVGWTWSDRAMETIRVVKHPGYAVGHKWKLHIQIDGEEMDNPPRGMGGQKWATDGVNFFPPDISARIRAGGELELVADMEIFESSVQPQHFWMPERGDYKILWRKRIKRRFP